MHEVWMRKSFQKEASPRAARRRHSQKYQETQVLVLWKDLQVHNGCDQTSSERGMSILFCSPRWTELVWEIWQRRKVVCWIRWWIVKETEKIFRLTLSINHWETFKFKKLKASKCDWSFQSLSLIFYSVFIQGALRNIKESKNPVMKEMVLNSPRKNKVWSWDVTAFLCTHPYL